MHKLAEEAALEKNRCLPEQYREYRDKKMITSQEEFPINQIMDGLGRGEG